MSSEKKHIVVIGAGVIGLQTAISLLEEGYRVTVIAKHLPGDQSIEYTSPWAGAQWRSHASDEDKEQQRWDMETYNHWLGIISRELNEPETTPKSGLGLYESVFFSTGKSTPWFAPEVLSFKSLPRSEIPSGFQTGQRYEAMMVNVLEYLEFLRNTAETLGAVMIRAALPTSTSLFGTLEAARNVINSQYPGSKTIGTISAFVNATGLAARNLVPDPDVFPVRGQIVVVAGSAKRITTVDDSPTTLTPENPNISYVLPRPNTNYSLIGGTKQANNWNAESSPEDVRSILERAKRYVPELLNDKGEFEVLGTQVGFRPARKGGARVELENIEGLTVVHSYGHGGAGFQNSVGSAKKVVRILNGALSESSETASKL